MIQGGRRTWSLISALGATFCLFLAGCARTESAKSEFNETNINGRPTLVVSVTDDTEAIFSFKVAGIPFVVANDRLHTILEGDLIARDELWTGFGFYSVLPDVSPLSEHDVYLFGRPSTESNYIHISVRRFCPTFRRAGDCDAKANLAKLLAMTSSAPLSDDWSVEPVAGLTPFLHRLGPSGDPSKPAPSEDLYDVGDTNNPDRDSYISCDRPELVPVPHCQHEFIWKDAVRVTLTYKRINIHGWRDIYQNVLKTLEELTGRPDEQPGKQIIYFPKEYYHG